jgi:hypothetical protein
MSTLPDATAAKAKRPPKPTYSDDYVRDISEAVYRIRLGDDAVRRALADPDRGETWLRNGAGSYDVLTRAYLDTLNSVGLRQREARDV